MKINLRKTSDFTLKNVASLIASKDDSIHRQLRVDINGIAYISDDVGNINIDDLAFRYETWCAGNGYSGVKASNDLKWVKQIFDSLNSNWPKPKSTYIDSW